jgi:hypothetical protein
MSEYKAQQMQRNSKLVKQFCDKYGFQMTLLNHGYQIRIEEIFDVYPVRQRWHFLVDGTRGTWTNIPDLRRVMLRKLESLEFRGEIGKVEVVEVDDEAKEYVPATFKPRPYQQEALEGLQTRELLYWPRRMGKRSGVMLVNGQPQFVNPEGFKATGTKPQVQNILVDEIGYWPDYKWWRNPIKWYNWRKMMKALTRREYKAEWTPPEKKED